MALEKMKLTAEDFKSSCKVKGGDPRWLEVAALNPGEAVEAWGSCLNSGGGGIDAAKKRGSCPKDIQLRTLKDGRKVFYKPHPKP